MLLCHEVQHDLHYVVSIGVILMPWHESDEASIAKHIPRRTVTALLLDDVRAAEMP